MLKVKAVVAAVLVTVSLGSIATPAYASDEASLPKRTVTKHTGDGVVVTETLDYAKSRYANIRAKAAADCPVGYLCMWEDAHAGGQAVMWNDVKGNHENDFTNVMSPGQPYGPNRWGVLSMDFNDQMSSWMNRTSRTWYWYFGANGTWERHQMGWSGDRWINVLDNENDHASSVYSWLGQIS
ncbi:peptidase inhibitor family I36 protein [Amycolatopsis keratiniphila]|uniref:peptidase inhibitor family I36 protein n=1 Tax=Amycolatopsis keratiniphila TaxID=129921 RepID=UPI003402C01C